MANEFVARKGLIVSSSAFVTGSLTVTNGITGSLFGSSSFATTASAATSITFIPSTASFAITASAADSITFIPNVANTASYVEFTNIVNIPTLISESSQVQLNLITGTTFANADFTFPQNLIVAGTLTAEEFYTEVVSSSIIYRSGSTQFGDSPDDTHRFTGSLSVEGTISGSLILPSGIVSSSTQAIDWTVASSSVATSASFATTASAATSITFTPPSASFSTTASYALNAGGTIEITGSAPPSPDTGDLWYDNTTGKTYIYYTSGSTSQWVLQSDPTYNPGPTLQDLQDVTDLNNTTTNAIIIANSTEATSTLTGALIVSGGLGVNKSIVATSITGSFRYGDLINVPTGILSSSTQINALTGISASFATTASAATSITFTPVSASFSTTSSFAVSSSRAVTSSFSTTSSFAVSSSLTVTASFAVSSSRAVTSSFAISSSQALSSSLAVTASFAVSSSYAVTASFSTTASAATSITFIPSSASFATTASFAVSASWAPGGNTFPFTGSADISGSLSINTTGTKALFSTYMEPGYTGENLWIGGGGQNVVSSDGIEGNFNTSFGIGALSASTSGYSNTAVGASALQKNTTGTANVAVGDYSLYEVTLGTNNVAVGSSALSAMKEYDGNTAVGYFGLLGLLTGSNNTTLGSLAGDSLTDGSRNTFIGSSAGTDVTSGSNNTILGRFSGNQNGLNITTANNYIVLSDGDGNPRIISDNNGNVGIGSVSPVNKLQIQGNVSASSYTSSISNGVGFFGTASWATNATTASFALNAGAGSGFPFSGSAVITGSMYITGSSNSVPLHVVSPTGSILFVTSSAKVGININDPQYTLHVNGAIFATDDITAFSDRRMKTNITPISNALTLVQQLEGVKFTRIDSDSNKKHVGFIAQEVQKILPEVVVGTDEHGYGVSYGNITALLVEAIKEQQKQIDELKSQLMNKLC